ELGHCEGDAGAGDGVTETKDEGRRTEGVPFVLRLSSIVLFILQSLSNIAPPTSLPLPWHRCPWSYRTRRCRCGRRQRAARRGPWGARGGRRGESGWGTCT